MTLLIVIAGASELIALWCAVGLWRSKVSVLRKFIWSVVLLVPVFGPVFYGGMFELPPVQPESLRSTSERESFPDHLGPSE
jgi:hypothetical protein